MYIFEIFIRYVVVAFLLSMTDSKSTTQKKSLYDSFLWAHRVDRYLYAISSAKATPPGVF